MTNAMRPTVVARPPELREPLTPGLACRESGSTDMRRMDRSLIRGIAWTGGIKWVCQVLSWSVTLVVARLLSRSDYGIAGMAAAYIGLVQLVSEFGVSAAVVQQRDLTEEQIAQLGGLSVALGGLFALISLLLSGPVAEFFAEPRLQRVIIVLSTTFVASGFQVLPRSLLARDLEFRLLAVIDGIENVTLTIATITLALLGTGYWALALGGLTARIVATIVLASVRWHRLARPTSVAEIRAPVVFGANVLLGNMAWYAFRSADMTVVGRMLGTAALGAYAIGFNLAAIPVDRVTGLISRATPAVLAAVQHDTGALRRYLLALTEGVAIITMPIAVGLALVARDFVAVVLGVNWLPAIGALRLLALAAVVRSIVPLTAQVLIARGDAKTTMRGTAVIAIILPPLFVVGARWGISGVAAMWLTAYPLLSMIAITRKALATADARWTQFLGALLPAATACAAMSLAVLALAGILPSGWPRAAGFAIKVVAGAATYAAALYGLHGERLRGFVAIVRGGITPQVA